MSQLALSASFENLSYGSSEESESDVNRRHILTTKHGPRAKSVKTPSINSFIHFTYTPTRHYCFSSQALQSCLKVA